MNYYAHNKSRLNIILSGLLPSFLSLFKKRDKNFIVLNSFLNTRFNENTKEFFLYLKNNTKYNVVFVINDYEARKKLIEQVGDFFIETLTFKGKMKALSAATWIITSFETPVGGIFLKFRRNVIHLQHGVPIKRSGLMEKDVSFVKKIYYWIIKTNVSQTLATSEVFVDYIRRFTGISKKNILVCGYPRFDLVLASKKTSKKDNTIRILYAPTWRHFGDVKLFPFEDLDMSQLNDFCRSKGIEIYMRLHPDFSDESAKSLYKYECIKSCSGRDEPDINAILYKFDMLITDYSSIFYDYYLLNRPIFYFDYDRVCFESEVGFVVDYDTFAVGYRPHTMNEFFSNIDDALQNDRYREDREKIRKVCIGESETNSEDLYKILCERKILKIL